VLSAHFEARQPSAIRLAQQVFLARTDGCVAINTAIGNVSLPMHPALQARMRALGQPGGGFEDGVVAYTPTAGTPEANAAVLNVLAASGANTEGLYTQITEGGSQGMELSILGACGPAGGAQHPLLMLDPAYTNYTAMALRTGRHVVSVSRTLQRDGHFTVPPMEDIELVIRATQPGALAVVPYGNPTGQLIGHEAMIQLAQLCVKHGMWFISDEAYRELYYSDDAGTPSSIWRIDDSVVPGIEGRRVSLETASKVWNACGLRIGALITDNAEFHQRAVAEQTANLCPSALGQHIYGALAHVSHAELHTWFEHQRAHYRRVFVDLAAELREVLPLAVVSRPDAAVYSVVDVRPMVGPDFEAGAFVRWCAESGQVDIDGVPHTLLVAPMAGFYTCSGENPGRTQMRIACVETNAHMALVPRLLAALLGDYLSR
jgi:aspartate aminotransferase